jgi:hypothetical protein
MLVLVVEVVVQQSFACGRVRLKLGQLLCGSGVSSAVSGVSVALGLSAIEVKQLKIYM